jgi:hypothetical protein
MPFTTRRTTLPIIFIFVLALIFITLPANAQNPIANSYYCRMRCDASFNICANQMGKSILPIPYPYHISSPVWVPKSTSSFDSDTSQTGSAIPLNTTYLSYPDIRLLLLSTQTHLSMTFFPNPDPSSSCSVADQSRSIHAAFSPM